MLKRLYILLSASILSVLPLSALDWCDVFGGDMTQLDVCQKCAEAQKAPYYYCDCHMGHHLYYGLDTILSDTTWFWVQVKDVRTTGVSAFWFSDAPVQIDAFIQCVQVEPYMSKRVGANRAYALDSKDIQKIIDASGMETVLDKFKIYFRVYPTQPSTSGRFIGLEYGKGLYSTCDSEVFPVCFGMNYPLSYSSNVYELPAADIPASPFFVQWKQLKGKPAVMSISLGECNAQPIVKDFDLVDSTKVYFPSQQLLSKAKADNQSLFFHFSHADDVYGVVSFINPVKWESVRVDTTLCYGKGLDLKDKIFYTDTCYRDTAWLQDNVCRLTEYNLTVTMPEPIDTTLCWTAHELATRRFLGFHKFSSFGSHQVYHEKEGECTGLYHVTVVENILSHLGQQESIFLLSPTCTQAGQPVALTLFSDAQVQITDLLGRVVQTLFLQAGSHTLLLDQPGNYLLQVHTDNALYNAKLLIR